MLYFFAQEEKASIFALSIKNCMKRKRLYFISLCGMLIAGILLTFSGCKKKKEYPETPFTQITTKKTVRLTEGASPICTFDLTFTYANGQNKSINNAINQVLIKEIFAEDSLSPKAAVDSFIKNYSLLYKTQTAALYKNDIKNRETNKWYSFYYILKTQQTNGGDSIICYLSDFEKFEGGPQAYHVKRWLNFNKENGKRITLDTIFKPGYESVLSELLLKKLMEKYNFKNENALHTAGFLNNAEMYPSDNYQIKEHAIVFLYNASEIAPYTAGETELTISLDDMEDWLKNKD